MGVQPLFEHGRIKLLIDPVTRRVVYLARDGVLPDRILIVDGPRQQVFSPASCEIVEFSGPLPARVNAQNCWDYRITSHGLEPALETPLPVERTA